MGHGGSQRAKRSGRVRVITHYNWHRCECIVDLIGNIIYKGDITDIPSGNLLHSELENDHRHTEFSHEKQ